MKQGNKRVGVIVAHIVAWVIFLLLPAFFNPRWRGTMSLSYFVADVLEPPRLADALLLIAIFYTNYYIVIPELYFRKKYVAFIFSIISFLGLFLAVNHFMRPMLPPPGTGRFGPPPGMLSPGASFNLFMFIIVLCSGFALCIYEQWQQMKQQMLQTEISFLKAQINPHFLFNALNSIYSLALEKSDTTADAIVQLSTIMRYSVHDAGKSVVPLENELEYIANYIELQRLRMTDKVKFSYDITGDPEGKDIVPFLLIPFVENTFKHGVNSEQDSDIQIKIEIAEAYIKLQASNRKVSVIIDKIKGTGIGIETTKKRLNLLYPGKHVLDIRDTSNSFDVLLQISL